MAEGNLSAASFCGSPFWDHQVTVNATDPDLTPCFQKTVLVWVPCGFLLLVAPFRIYDLKRNGKGEIPLSCLCVAKLVFGALIGVIALIDIFKCVQEFSSGRFNLLVNLLSPLVLLLTMILADYLLHVERVGGIHSSGVMLVFWWLLFVTGLVTFRSKIKQALSEDRGLEDLFRFITFFLYYPLVLVQLMLSAFVDKPFHLAEVHHAANPCPEESASFLSRITFWWCTSIIIKGYKKPLVKEDLWSLNQDLASAAFVPKFYKHWEKQKTKSRSPSEPEGVQVKMRSEGGRTYSEVSIVEGREKKHKPSLVLALMKAYGSTCVIAAAYKLIHDILLFVNPILLKFLINFTNNKSEYEWKGYYYATAMLVFAQVQSFVLHQYFHLCMVLGMKLRAALISAVYQKTLTLSNAARKLSTVGEIVNLMSVDAQVFMDSMTYINTIWSAPFQISVCLFFLWQTLGPSVLAGLAVMILLIPLNGVLAAKIKALQAQQMNLKDSRIKLMNEVLNGIKVLKLYAWELSFQDKILATRSKELNILKKSAYLNSFTTFTWMCAPVFVSLTTFAVYVLSDSDNVLSAEKAFVALSLFNLLRFPLIMLPQVVTNVIQLSVSAKRIKNFLSLEELDPQAVKQSSTSENGITIKDGTFLWEKGGPAILKNINLDIPEGSLTAVVGVVGSGKSSLISAMLGEMEISQSTITLKGRLAYVTQQAWIQNDTLQNNILFGKTLNKRKYTEILEACALISDLEMLPAGDQTEIGEKGINLSGGQKQRVNLARAIYQDTDIYLLDDPLSAVDSHVGKHIFDHVIGSNGLLAEKVDMIVVLKNGEISERGTYKQLVSCDGAFAEFLKTYLAEQMEESVESLNELILQENDVQEGSESISISKRNVSGQEERRITLSFSDVSAFSNESSKADKWQQSQEKMPEQKADDKLVQEESSETGRVKFSVFQTYVKAIGAILVLVTLFFYVAFNAVSVYSNIWLSEWTEDVTRSNGTMTTHQRNMRLGVYGALGLLQGMTVMLSAFLMVLAGTEASKRLFHKMLENRLHAPLQFYDETPAGRIMNRFSSDVADLDFVFPFTIRSMLNVVLSAVSIIGVIAISIPLFLAPLSVFSIIFFLIQRFYVASSRQLKRIESVSRSPIYSHFGETVTGVSTIRAFGQQSRFIKESESRVDDNNASYYPTLAANRWLAIRLEFMANCIVFFAAVFAVLSRDSLSAGSVGLSITYALSVTQTLNWMVRMTSELETNIVAVERIKEYADSPTEASWVISDKRPDPHWPQKGQVHFQNYATRYREGLDLVIKGIDCQIRSREKVGVVGRTGAGKSSLTMALFRIIEPASGTIFIDDINISEIGLHDLRSKLTIIPQDPVVFSGTLRMNLDPFDCYTDSDIWKALEHAHLKDFVSSLTEQLHYKCSEGGENLSMGQRQLLCLARALLRKTKILILDEATAAVDLETDDLIQQTIRVEFAECTVLTIAHRLNTIMDYSRILVLDAGKICEFDSPANLLKNNKSVFYGMVKAAGLV